MTRKDIPNIISVIRILLVIPTVWLIYAGDYFYALIVFLIAGISDGIDGYLAKRFQWQSRLGSILDPIADKLLLVSTYFAMAWVELIPMWLLVAVLLRDIVIIVGSFAYHILIGQFEMAPSLISKFNTVMQILLIGAVLSVQITEIPMWAINVFVYITLVTIMLSGLDYVIVWSRKALSSQQIKIK